MFFSAILSIIKNPPVLQTLSEKKVQKLSLGMYTGDNMYILGANM